MVLERTGWLYNPTISVDRRVRPISRGNTIHQRLKKSIPSEIILDAINSYHLVENTTESRLTIAKIKNPRAYDACDVSTISVVG